MEKTLSHLDSNYGGVEDFLLGQLGVDPDIIEILRLNLLV